MSRRNVLWILTALVSAGVYLMSAWARGVSGFPLDDAWIHQVYARNLATRGEFAFFAGQPSTGSTSPLWTMLLAVGYLLSVDFRVWTYVLGIACLASSAYLISRSTFHILQFQFQVSSFTFFRSSAFGLRLSSFVLPSIFVLFEWHLVWSAVSGMEIPLFIFLALLFIERLLARASAWLLGVLAGLLTLTRPEGIGLAVLVGGGMLFDLTLRRPCHTRCGILRMAYYLIAFTLVLLPYLAFHWTTSGVLLPNTFYAKSVEYAELFTRAPFLARWIKLLFTPFVGAQILLVPGLLYAVIALAREQQWRVLIPFAWILLLPALYAWHLPVAYQHGRYEMPIIPFIILYGIWGTAALLVRVRNFIVRATWTLSIVITLIVFWLLGAAQYATDVAIIDCEMVQTAHWVTANAPANAVLAAHDIGALGYFYARPFVDLAGLVSPEVIPFIRDENRLREYLFSRQVTWIIVFPGWYPTFDADSRFVPVYQTNCAVTRMAGEKNMVIYAIRSN